jgi:hypothetical protein
MRPALHMPVFFVEQPTAVSVIPVTAAMPLSDVKVTPAAA